MWLYVLFIIAVSIFLLIKKQYSYWDGSNIPHLKTEFPFGAAKPLMQKKRTFGLILSDIYRSSTHKVLGIYIFFKPYVLIRDAQLSRQIMTTDFSSFHDRGLYVDEKHDSLSTNLFSLPGQSWRTLRAKLTPSFTSGKLKGMFETIDDIGGEMVDYLNKDLVGNDKGKEYDIKIITTNYAVDVIGSVIFGLKNDSFSNPENEFRKMHQEALYIQGIIDQIFNAATFMCPPVAMLMARLGYRDPVIVRMRDIIKSTVEYRENHNYSRKDLLQLLIQLRNSGKISEDDDKIWQVETVAENLKAMSIDMIGANAFLFYIAGTETTAATAAFTIYELSMYPGLLERAQTEVLEVLEKHQLKANGKFTYEAMQDMKFLELCIMETTRKYPGLPFLNRECTQDYEVPDTKYVIKKGTQVLIPLLAIQRDPQYFPDPLRYNPERYLDESKEYDPVAFMPFGEGPRHCIAQRMGKMSSKLAVAKVLANFNIETRERQEVEFKFDPSIVLIPEHTLNVRLSKKW